MATPDALEIPLAINLLAVFLGALGGTIRAGEDERTDLVGVFTLAAAMGFGGGIVRDLLLGNLPPAALRDPLYLVAAAAAALLGMVALYYLRKLGPVLWWLDAMIIGLFACVGANAALLQGLTVLPAVLIGTLASVGGLILTDMLQGRPSTIMHVGPPNAIAGLAGALVYAALYTGTRPLVSTTAAVAVTLLVRLSGRFWHVQVPQPRLHAYEMRTRRKEAGRRVRRARRGRGNQTASTPADQ
ncbi:TRIC cation channel family protein [Demequina capsici]|uniref:TRIC cation channel family protein n=1 Tax=Demequina capsici TaxID=3075620 RepID=A0AA96JFB9_9MICO|nr:MULTISPECIES: TRIC cation channel family protein [unclassified Demequina]WNM23815.1 TRIC cation channel family protein [Demequina sp. OYTSA14]WNM26654.1 TRIC cation channel family protein [Demequina sp. PMTSA13]